MDLKTIQAALREAQLDGWLFYDFRHSDPLAGNILGLDPETHASRRWFYYIPAEGEATRIVHSIERGALDAVAGKKLVYLPWQQLEQHVGDTLQGSKKIAMQFSPRNAIPYVSRVDAGTIELVRSFGIEVVSSADLVQQFEAVWSPEQYETHNYAATKISQLIDDTFEEIRRRIKADGQTTEFEIQQWMWNRYEQDGLISDHPSIVGVNANSANPHYCPTADKTDVIKAGDFVLVDTWAKKNVPGAVYFDITWTGFIGSEVPDEIQNVFNIVSSARDAAISAVQDALDSGREIYGWQVDDACREVISKAGFGEQFIHRTGHSIHTEVHGNGANIDNLETRDERQIMKGTCFSIEPGVYLEGRFGVRSEVDVYIDGNTAVVTGRPRQTEIVLVPIN